MPTPTSKPCESKPFMVLADDNSNAPILDYNIPQKNCIPLYSSIRIFNKDHWFIKKSQILRPDPFWKALKDKSIANIKKLILQDINSGSNNIVEGVNFLNQSPTPIVFYDTDRNVEGNTQYQSEQHSWAKLICVKGMTREIQYDSQSISIKEKNLEPSPTGTPKNVAIEQIVKQDIQVLKIPKGLASEFDLHQMAEKASQGYKVRFELRPGGRIIAFYHERPTAIKRITPRLYIKFEMMQCSYLGNYGAGETINTMSLLPGEKTSISVRTYKNSAFTRSRSENVLDSISENSISSFESALQSQSGSSTDSSSSVSITQPGSVTTNGTGLIPSLFWDWSKTTQNPSTGTAVQSHVSSVSSQVSSAVSQTVNESNHHRDININTSTLEETQFGEETTIIREFENINRSRTLNFVFRRLLQNHTVVLWLKNIKFGIITGVPGHYTGEEVQINQLEDFVNTYILKAHRKEALEYLLKKTIYIFNHNQKPIKFFECTTFDVPQEKCDCNGITIPADKFCMWVKNPKLEDTHDNITVPGVILNVTNHVLRTPGIIVDSLLGQGEALDCYNTHLQQQNIISLELNNERTRQAIGIIDGFSTPEDKAKNYKKIFGECCEDKDVE